MRIRKQASKLLGWASCSPFPSSSSPLLSVSDQYSWPTAPPPILSPKAYAGELQCQLNLSPWDAIESPQCTNSQESKLEAVNEEQTSVFENGFEAKEEEEGEEIEEKVEDKKGQGRKRREKETEASSPAAIIKCKKTDGKGWHCKRLAQNPHSLCTYHLTQLRSYRARFEDQVSSYHRKKSAPAVDCGGAASNYYYYYSILGPWWGKRRGPVNESSEWNEESEISPKNRNGKSADNEVVVDGDNGDDNDDEEEEEEDGDDGETRSDVTFKKKKKKRMIKRRGRKPVKARSLKSLL